MALSGAERQKRYIDKLKRQAAAAAVLARRVAELEAAQAAMRAMASPAPSRARTRARPYTRRRS